MENNKEVVLRKIPLKLIIEILTDLWDRGADYVDIIGIPNEVQDNIAIAALDEYFTKGDDDESRVKDVYEIDFEEDFEEDTSLNDEDLNELI